MIFLIAAVAAGCGSAVPRRPARGADVTASVSRTRRDGSAGRCQSGGRRRRSRASGSTPRRRQRRRPGRPPDHQDRLDGPPGRRHRCRGRRRDPADHRARRLRQRLRAIRGRRGAQASVTFRIPADAMGRGAVAASAASARRSSTSALATEDVTGQVVDLAARIRNLQATEAALQAIMDRATEIKDVLEVQAELTTVRGQIEQLDRPEDPPRGAGRVLDAHGHVRAEAATRPRLSRRRSSTRRPRSSEASASLVGVLQALATAGIWFAIVWLPILHRARDRGRDRRRGRSSSAVGRSAEAPPVAPASCRATGRLSGLTGRARLTGRRRPPRLHFPAHDDDQPRPRAVGESGHRDPHRGAVPAAPARCGTATSCSRAGATPTPTSRSSRCSRTRPRPASCARSGRGSTAVPTTGRRSISSRARRRAA